MRFSIWTWWGKVGMRVEGGMSNGEEVIASRQRGATGGVAEDLRKGVPGMPLRSHLDFSNRPCGLRWKILPLTIFL